MLRSLSPLLLACAAMPVCTAVETTDLLDLSTTIQELSNDNLRLQMNLSGAIAKEGSGADLWLSADLSEGKPGKAYGNSRSWNKASHTVEIKDISYDGKTVSGTLAVTLQADQWVPKDGQPIPMEVSFTGTATSLYADGSTPFEGDYWDNADKRSGKLALVEGTFTATSAKLGNTSGKMSGNMKLPGTPGKWTKGVAEDGGLKVGFDMGSKRVNWNKFGFTRLNFDSPMDLRKHAGLRVQLDSHQTRDDSSVSVWLREADGSWYYYSQAIPLVADSNQADILFADFEEAEWVSPDGGTSFMDEDYELDLSQITAVALGVVNAHGIGPVGFTLTDIDLLPEADAPEPVTVTVTGKTLSVNDHDMVPAGLFGGFAPFLPQRYRPGTQRNLNTLPGAYVQNPFKVYLYGGSQVNDGIAFAKAVAAGTWPELDALVPEKNLKAIKKQAVEPKKEKSKQRWPGNARKESVKYLNAVLSNAKLLELPALAGKKDLITQAKNAEAGSGDDLLARRQLVDGLLPEHVKPYTSGRAHEAFIIDCQGDRTQMATYLKQDDWKEYLTKAGTAVGEQNKRFGNRVHSEFWNEPYLNWQKGTNFNTKHFRTDLAGEDKPVIVRRKDGSTDDVVPHFEWYRAKDKKGNEVWKIRDPTAFTYWSAKGNEFIYNEMLAVYGKAVKEANPDAIVTGGWGMKWNEDSWAAWDLLYLPTFEKNIQYIDGVHEHHYMGDTTDIGGSYEVLTAYSVIEHDKWLYGYNTETNDLLDIPAVGEVNSPEKAAQAKNFRVGSYNLRDIIYLIAQTPDKAMARTMIHWDHTKSGSDMVFDTLKDLRGRLVEGTSSDSKVWVATGIDGTDPVARRPEGGHALVTAIWNDHREAREVSITLAAPTGTSFSTGTWEAPRQNPETLGVTFDKGELAASGAEHTLTVTIPARSVWKASIPLTGTPVEQAEVSRHQFFGDSILDMVMPGKAVETGLKIDDKKLAAAKRAWIRCVLEHAAEGEAVVSIGGTDIVLPKAVNRDNGNLIVEIPVDLGLLKADNALAFRVADGNHAGYRLAMSSIVLE